MPGHGKTELARRKEQFLLAYSVTGNGAAAAVAAGYNPENAKYQAERFMQRDGMRERATKLRESYLAGQAAAFERQTSQLRSAADRAILTLLDVLERGKSEIAKVRASELILDRAGHTPIERVEATSQVTITAADTNEVDTRLDSLFKPRGSVPRQSGDSSTSH